MSPAEVIVRSPRDKEASAKETMTTTCRGGVMLDVQETMTTTCRGRPRSGYRQSSRSSEFHATRSGGQDRWQWWEAPLLQGMGCRRGRRNVALTGEHVRQRMWTPAIAALPRQRGTT
jgi:hypothetical protein